MLKKQSKNLNKGQKEAMANALAAFFFEYWQKQSIKGNQVAAVGSGLSRRGGFPETTAAS